MTGRKRFIKLFTGQTIDRIPVSPFIYNNFIFEFFRSSDIDPVEKGIEVYEHFGFDIILRTCNVWEYMSEKLCDSRNWRYYEVKQGSEKEWEVISTITTPEKVLTQISRYKQITRYEVIQAVVEYYIKEKSDFEQFLKYQPPVPEYDCSVIKKARELIGEKGMTAPWAQGAFNSASFYRKLDDLIMDPYIDIGMYDTMLEYFSNRMLKVIDQFAKAGADIVCCSGNVANGTMAGPEHFKKYVLPYEIDFTNKVKAMNLYYLYHNCGDADSLLHLYSDIKMNIYESLTPYPYGDTVFDDALLKIDGNIVLCGNIDQIDFLKNACVDEIFREVENITTKAKKRGNFILATTDYLSEGTPHENIAALSEAGRKFGIYL